MFFFGLFSTQIPYIVLAVLYLVGFGAYSVNSIKNKNNIEISADKVINYVATANINKASNASYYNSAQPQKKVVQKKSIGFFINKLTFIDKREGNKSVRNKILTYSCQVPFNLFSRPPPILA